MKRMVFVVGRFRPRARQITHPGKVWTLELPDGWEYTSTEIDSGIPSEAGVEVVDG